MATGTTKVKTEVSVVLELDNEEAQFIHDILWHGVTGSEKKSRRKYLSPILKALNSAGVEGNPLTDVDFDGTIVFLDQREDS